MWIDEHRQRVHRQIRGIQGLTQDDCEQIAGLDLGLYDSLAVAYLRHAKYLLTHDAEFDWKAREKAWHKWRENILYAITGSLRFKEDDPLILTVGVCEALFPLVHRGALLMAYKTIGEVALFAQRDGHRNKRERHEVKLRLKEIITRTRIWHCPPDRLILDSTLTDTDRADLAPPCQEVAGLTLKYFEPSLALRMINVITPIRHYTRSPLTLIIPA